MSESTYGRSAYGRHPYGGHSVDVEFEGTLLSTASASATATASATGLVYIHALVGSATANATGTASLIIYLTLVAQDLEITFTVVGHLSRPVAFSPPAGLDREDYSQVNVVMTAPTSYSEGKPET